MILRVFGSIALSLATALFIVHQFEQKEPPQRQGSICVKENAHKVVCYCGESLCGESGVMP